MIPTTDGILTQLRAMLPELRTRFGIQRVGLYGTFTRPDANTQTIDLLVEAAEPLGLEFGVLRQLLAESLHWSVSLHTLNMLPASKRERLLSNLVYA